MNNEEARDKLCNLLTTDRYVMSEHYDAVVKGVEALENAPKKGEWLKRTLPSGITVFYCTECAGLEFHKSKFCPNCGADMRGEG